MASITLGGSPASTIGNLPEIGSIAPDFTLTKLDLSEASIADFKGQKLVPQTLRKIQELRKWISDLKLDINISVDGN